MYPITRGLLPATVLVWGESNKIWFAEIDDMMYTYVLFTLTLKLYSENRYKPIYYGWYYETAGAITCFKSSTPNVAKLNVSNLIGIVELDETTEV